MIKTNLKSVITSNRNNKGNGTKNIGTNNNYEVAQSSSSVSKMNEKVRKHLELKTKIFDGNVGTGNSGTPNFVKKIGEKSDRNVKIEKIEKSPRNNSQGPKDVNLNSNGYNNVTYRQSYENINHNHIPISRDNNLISNIKAEKIKTQHKKNISEVPILNNTHKDHLETNINNFHNNLFTGVNESTQIQSFTNPSVERSKFDPRAIKTTKSQVQLKASRNEERQEDLMNPYKSHSREKFRNLPEPENLFSGSSITNKNSSNMNNISHWSVSDKEKCIKVNEDDSKSYQGYTDLKNQKMELLKTVEILKNYIKIQQDGFSKKKIELTSKFNKKDEEIKRLKVIKIF